MLGATCYLLTEKSRNILTSQVLTHEHNALRLDCSGELVKATCTNEVPTLDFNARLTIVEKFALNCFLSLTV